MLAFRQTKATVSPGAFIPGRLRHALRENSVIRFLLAHLLTLGIVMMICASGFHSALDIVRQDILESSGFAMEQAVEAVTNRLVTLRIIGLQVINTDSIRELGSSSPQSSNYAFLAQRAVKDYTEYLLYHEETLDQSSFLYFQNLDRVLYRGSVYRPEVFRQYLDRWNIDDAQWQTLSTCTDPYPRFWGSKSGDLYYIFPCTQPFQGQHLGALYFRIGHDEIRQQFSFLEEYKDYTLLICDESGQLVYSEDRLGLAETTPVSHWLEGAEARQEGSNLIWTVKADERLGLWMVLVLPEQAAMRKLTALSVQTLGLTLLAGILGCLISLYFSLRSGRPVNAMARALRRTEEGLSVDLDHIGDAVRRLLEDNKNLQLQKEQAKPALRKAFFHDLLKSDFVSRSEMEYMAGRAGLSLTGGTYCAAVMRLHPQIDIDAIDGQTVEEARILQQAVSAEIDARCAREVWSYKRSTLITLYIFDIQNQEPLLQILRNVVEWLHRNYQVEACWGVSTPCTDLMDFWKNSEEASAALRENDGSDPVVVYSCARKVDDLYYLPYIVEDRLVQGLRSGDGAAVETVLGLLQQENFVRRNLGRIQFQRFSRRIVEILAARMEVAAEDSPELTELNRLAFAFHGDCEPYFEALNSLCHALCEDTARQKSARRSENVRAIEGYIQTHYRDPNLCLAMVSAEFGLSEGYLSSIFKKETGTNFAEYLEQLRVKAARVLLEDGTKVTDVSHMVGYNSIQSFRRAFKRVMGVSPSEYRR